MLTIALAKGYLLEEALKLFTKIGLKVPASEELKRKLEFTDSTGNFRFLIIRPVDVPVYVEYGAADLGITGKDVLVEGRHKVAELLDLKFGYCKLAVAGLKKNNYKSEDFHSGMRVATKFVNSAADFFQKRGLEMELIKLYGSVELAPIDGLSDLIVDLVASGRTLKENGLEVIEPIYETTARLIANSVRVKSRYDEIVALSQKIKREL